MAWIGSAATHRSCAGVDSLGVPMRAVWRIRVAERPGGGAASLDRRDAEEAPGVVAVATDLDDEVVDRVELELVAQAVHELDPGHLAVEVALEVEQVRLEQRVRLVVVEGR